MNHEGNDKHQPKLQQANHVQQLQNQEKGSQGSNKLQEANHVQNCKTNNNDHKEQMATNQTRKAFEKKNCQPSIKLS